MPDFVVTPALLNRRTGPSLDDPVVEVLPRGKMISGSDQGNGWVRTVSSEGTTYAMSRYLVELTTPRAEAIGIVSLDAPAGGGIANVPVSFPTNRFQKIPTVLAAPSGTIPANVCMTVTDVADAAGMLLRTYRSTDGRIRVAWHAIEGGN